MTEIQDLKEELLKKSQTWLRYHEAFGRCTRCHEMVEVLQYCCTGRSYFEGGEIDSDELWAEIEAELVDAYADKF